MCISREDVNKEDIIKCPEEEGVINIGSQCVTVQSEKKNYQVCILLRLHSSVGKPGLFRRSRSQSRCQKNECIKTDLRSKAFLEGARTGSELVKTPKNGY